MSLSRAVRVRLSLLALVTLIGGGGLAFTTLADRAIDTRLNDELAFVYDTHLKTVHEIVNFAHAHAIEPDPNLKGELARAAPPPDPRDHLGFRSYERRHDVIAGSARELITTLDGAVDPEDGRLAKLIRRFDSEERNLHHIRERFHSAGLINRLADLVP